MICGVKVYFINCLFSREKGMGAFLNLIEKELKEKKISHCSSSHRFFLQWSKKKMGITKGKREKTSMKNIQILNNDLPFPSPINWLFKFQNLTILLSYNGRRRILSQSSSLSSSYRFCFFRRKGTFNNTSNLLSLSLSNLLIIFLMGFLFFLFFTNFSCVNLAASLY